MPRPRSHRSRAVWPESDCSLCDVDGVLTDCALYMDGRSETKQFNIQDGFGLRLLQRQGIKVGWISGRTSPATSQRARELRWISCARDRRTRCG